MPLLDPGRGGSHREASTRTNTRQALNPREPANRRLPDPHQHSPLRGQLQPIPPPLPQGRESTSPGNLRNVPGWTRPWCPGSALVLCHEDAVEFGKVGWDIGEDGLERVPSGSVRPQASRTGPKRNRWPDLQAFDDRLVEIELRRDGISRQVNELSAASPSGTRRSSPAGTRTTSKASGPSREPPSLSSRLAICEPSTPLSVFAAGDCGANERGSLTATCRRPEHPTRCFLEGLGPGIPDRFSRHATKGRQLDADRKDVCLGRRSPRRPR
jgi:hypothetical protein